MPRALEVLLDETNSTATKTWEYQASSGPAIALGDVERLPNGNVLVTTSTGVDARRSIAPARSCSRSTVRPSATWTSGRRSTARRRAERRRRALRADVADLEVDHSVNQMLPSGPGGDAAECARRIGDDEFGHRARRA